jgi:hypothetical protein
MKKKYIIFILILAVMGTWGSCKKDFLTVAPTGSMDQVLLQSPDGIEALLVSAYSMLDGETNQNGFSWEPAQSNWVWGSIRGMEANKGSDSGDQQDINSLMTYSEDASNPYLNVTWRVLYEAISRCNSGIIIVDKALAASKITADQADGYYKEFKTLRGWFHFAAWRMWAKIPYVDEKTDTKTVTNTADITGKIIDDLTQGTTLPLKMGAIGKFNQTVAKVLLAKAMMQMNHNYAGAKTLLLDVAANGKKPNGDPIGLAPTYGEIFDTENRNGIESVYTVQYSVNDGSSGFNAGNGEVLNFPYKSGGSPGGCCGFFCPTQDFVNSFRVDANGLPMLDDTYNTPANQILRDFGVAGGGLWDATKKYDINQGCTAYQPSAPFTDLGYVSLIKDNTGNNPLTSPAAWALKWTEDNSKVVDPRLDWSVGRRGIPYWDWGVHTGADWIRSQQYSGTFSPKKQVYKKSQEGKYTEVGNWTSGWTANGYRMIRYADVLLMLAECQIESATPDLDGAMANINLVRARAANTAGYVFESDGITPAATYNVKEYVSFPDQDYARKALRMERKLELGQEGHRYFDMQRWGATYLVTELNRALTYEKTMPWGDNLYGTAVVGAEDVTFPIPQRQLDLSNGMLVQR